LPYLVSGRYDIALEVVNSFLRCRPSQSTRGEALCMRSSLWQSLGVLHRAKRDALAGCRLREPRSYGRYVMQYGLGHLSEKLGNPQEAIEWYRAALKTVAASRDISGGGVLEKWLALCPEKDLSPSDRTLSRKAARRSWKALHLSGEPRPKDLERLAQRLLKQQGLPPVRQRREKKS